MAIWQEEIGTLTEQAEKVPEVRGGLRRTFILNQKWMYDFMMQFLSSPIWRVSILDFVDNKCIVFDNEEENKFEYTIIHNVCFVLM